MKIKNIKNVCLWYKLSLIEIDVSVNNIAKLSHTQMEWWHVMVTQFDKLQILSNQQHLTLNLEIMVLDVFDFNGILFASGCPTKLVFIPTF